MILSSVRGIVRKFLPYRLRRQLIRFLPVRHPFLSVVVPIYNVEEYLSDCLESLTRQTYSRLDIIIVDDGSPDCSYDIAVQYAKRDARIRIKRQRNAGLGAARNTGVKFAIGSYVTFLDSDDTLPRNAYQVMMRTLRASGSDFVVGTMQRAEPGRTWVPNWARDAHSRRRIGVDITQHPDIILDVFAWNKIYRTQFFKQSIKAFPVGIRYEDQLPSLVAYVKANAFDVLPEIVYRWHIRADGSSISQQKACIADISDRLSVINHCIDFARQNAPTTVYERLLEKVLSLDLRPYIDQMARQGSEYWAIAQQPIADILTDTEENIISKLHPMDRALLSAIKANARDDLVKIATNVSAYGRDYRVAIHGNRTPRAQLAFTRALRNPMDDRWLCVTEDAAVQGVESKLYDIEVAGKTIFIKGSVFVRHMLPSDIGYQITMINKETLCSVEHTRIEKNIDISDLDRINHSHIDYSAVGFLAEFTLPGDIEKNEQWLFKVAVNSPSWRHTHEHLITRVQKNGPLGYAACLDQTTGTAYQLSLTQSTDECQALTLALAPPKHVIRPQRLRTSGNFVAVSEAQLHGDELHCKGTYRAPNGKTGLKLAFFSSTGEPPLRPTKHTLAFGEFTAVFQLAHDGKPIAANRAILRLTFADGNGVERSIWSCVSYNLNRLLPAAVDRNEYRVKVSRSPKAGALHIDITPPWAPAERGKYNQTQLQLQYYSWVHRNDLIPDSFLFESFGGARCDDSPLELSLWVRANRPDATIYWSIKDHSVSIPEGTIPIVRFSRDWYEALASAQYLVNNNNFPYSFRKALSQVYIQTWHGTPLKRIGNDVPAENLSLAYRALMAREAESWDYLLAQNEYSVEYLNRAFDYRGQTLLTGYPRNDHLAATWDSADRLNIRRQLGIPDESLVILYAPTWRDTAKLRTGGYNLELYLDIERVLSELPDVTVLVRGHPNTLKSSPVNFGSRCLDVRNYPRLTNLFMASDYLVTDYSSIMFDFANTGKPILYLVPDLNQYASTTRGFYEPLESIAPGPLCFDTDEILRWMETPVDLAGQFRDKYNRFVNRFLPLDDGAAAERVWEAVLVERTDRKAANASTKA